MASSSALRNWSKISRTNSSAERRRGRFLREGRIGKMERWQIDVAESELRVAESLYRMARNREERLDAGGKIVRARACLETARDKFRQVQVDAMCIVASAVVEHCNDLIYRPFLAQARQSSATFIAREAADGSGGASSEHE